MKQEILEKARKNGNLITTAQAVNCGVSKTMLSKYVDNGELLRIEHGIYALPDTIIDNLLVLHLKNRNIIFSHESALFLNGIASRTPFTHTVTVESTKTLPSSIKKQCTCFYVDSKLFKIGLTHKRRHSEIQSLATMRKEQYAISLEAVAEWTKKRLSPP